MEQYYTPRFISATLWFLFLFILIVLISIRLFSDIYKASRGDTKRKVNDPFSNERKKSFRSLTSVELLELEYGSTLPVIALTASVMTWGLIYFLQEEMNGFITEVRQLKGLSIGAIIIVFAVLGIFFMRNILKGIGQGNDLHDTTNLDIIFQRAKTVVTTYLSLLLGALVFTFLSDISFELKIIRFAPMSFIIGSAYYLLLRQKPDQARVTKIFLAAVKSPNLDLKQQTEHADENTGLAKDSNSTQPVQRKDAEIFTRKNPYFGNIKHTEDIDAPLTNLNNDTKAESKSDYQRSRNLSKGQKGNRDAHDNKNDNDKIEL